MAMVNETNETKGTVMVMVNEINKISGCPESLGRLRRKIENFEIG